MSNISFQGNPQQAVAAAGGIIAAIASAPAWLLGAAAVAAVGGAAYVINKASKEEKKKYSMNFNFKHFLKRPRHIEVEDCSAGIIFPAPDNYDKLLAKFREFKATMK